MVVQPVHGEGQPFAEMAEDDSEPRKGIEHPREDDAQEMAAGVHREAPAGARQLLVALEVGLHGVRVRQRWMQVDRYAERLRALEDRPVLALVEKAAARVPMDHRALEAELADATLELLRRGFRVRRWQRRKPGKASGILLDCL